MSDGWSVVLPVKDELDMLGLSLPSIMRLGPDEIALVLDQPRDSKESSSRSLVQEQNDRIRQKAKSLGELTEYNGNLRIIEAARNKEWNFHQAWVRRYGYLSATRDKIFTFDVDTVVTPNILKGYPIIGKDNVAFVTFRKRHKKAVSVVLADVRRHSPRRIFTVNPSRPFIGIYWLYRPYYLDLVPEDEIRRIYNGEDTFVQVKLAKQNRYHQVHLDIVGCHSLRIENEDESWRQYQLGLWLGANKISFLKVLLQFLSKAYPGVIRGYFASRHLPRGVTNHLANLTYAEATMYLRASQ